jgi:hypothetical protein
MGIPPYFIDLLKSWTAQSRITLCVEGSLLQPSFPQEMGVPQGGVLSPILFNIVQKKTKTNKDSSMTSNDELLYCMLGQVNQERDWDLPLEIGNSSTFC